MQRETLHPAQIEKEGVVKEGKGGVAMWVWQSVLTALSPAGGGRAPPVW